MGAHISFRNYLEGTLDQDGLIDYLIQNPQYLETKIRYPVLGIDGKTVKK